MVIAKLPPLGQCRNTFKLDEHALGKMYSEYLYPAAVLRLNAENQILIFVQCATQGILTQPNVTLQTTHKDGMMRFNLLLAFVIACSIVSECVYSQESSTAGKHVSVGDSMKIVYNETGRIDVELQGEVTSIENGNIVIADATKTYHVHKQIPYTNLIPYFGDFFKSVSRRTPQNVGRIDVEVSK